MFERKRILAWITPFGLATLFGIGCLSDSGPTAPATGSEGARPPAIGVGITAGAGPTAFAAVRLRPHGATGVEGQIEFFETKSGVLAVGEARKMDPASRYVTMLFDELSSGNGDGCVAGTGPAPYEIGRWRVDGAGRGSIKVFLDPALLGEFARIGTASVHRLDGPGPSVSALVACGRVESLE